VWTQFATSSRRLSTDSVDNLETEHSGLTTWILIDIDNFFNSESMTLLCRHLSPTAQEIVNWVDCRRMRSHRRYDATRLRCRQMCWDLSRLSPTSCELCTHRRHNSTRQLSRVGGVYWALGPYYKSKDVCAQCFMRACIARQAVMIVLTLMIAVSQRDWKSLVHNECVWVAKKMAGGTFVLLVHTTSSSRVLSIQLGNVNALDSRSSSNTYVRTYIHSFI